MVRRRVGVTGDGGRDGQMHTIEGLSAAMLLVLAISFAIQSVSLTATSASTASAEIEQQYAQLAEDVLKTAKASGSLERAILNWDTSAASFEDSVTERSAAQYYSGKEPPGEFGRQLELHLVDNDLAYNIDLRYKEGNDQLRTRYVYNGAPSTNAVTVSTTMILSESDELGDGTTLVDSNYPVSDLSQPGLYNIVEVELTVWRR